MPDLEAIQAFITPKHVAFAKRVADVAQSQLRTLPHPSSDDDGRRQARDVLGLMGKAKLFEPVDPLDLTGCCLARETIAAASTLADDVFALQALGSRPIALAGGDAIRRKLLPGVASGRLMAAFAMTEPEAGSDVAAIQTRATADNGDYVINGEKTLISNAGIADFYTVFASTDPERGSRGLSAFVVEKDNPGLEFVGPQVLSAPHPLGTMRFTDCRVPASARLGDEGQGFKLGMTTLDSLRTTVAAAACGMAERALDEALSYAMERQQFGQALADFQLIQQKLGRSATDLTASRLLVYRAAHAKDSGKERVSMECSMAKLFATEAAQRIIDDAVQIVGGRGVLADHIVDQLYRAIRPLRIYEGTSEVQHIVIARMLVKAQTTR